MLWKKCLPIIIIIFSIFRYEPTDSIHMSQRLLPFLSCKLADRPRTLEIATKGCLGYGDFHNSGVLYVLQESFHCLMRQFEMRMITPLIIIVAL